MEPFLKVLFFFFSSLSICRNSAQKHPIRSAWMFLHDGQQGADARAGRARWRMREREKTPSRLALNCSFVSLTRWIVSPCRCPQPPSDSVESGHVLRSSWSALTARAKMVHIMVRTVGAGAQAREGHNAVKGLSVAARYEVLSKCS